MNQFFELFGGLIAVLLSIISATIISRRWSNSRSPTSRRMIVVFLYWGPLFLMSCMLLHIIQNAYRAYVSIYENKVFNFYFYSLQLFGFVVGYQSYLLLQNCRRHVAGHKRFNRKLLLNIGLMILTTLPTFAFTPIGIIPSCVLFITFIMSATTHRSAKVMGQPATQNEMIERLYQGEVVT